MSSNNSANYDEHEQIYQPLDWRKSERLAASETAKSDDPRNSRLSGAINKKEDGKSSRMSRATSKNVKIVEASSYGENRHSYIALIGKRAKSSLLERK